MNTDSQWFQLTYTSADHPGAERGGWGVKEATPDLPEAVAHALRTGVVTRIDEVTPTSQFASVAELHNRPRRLQASTLGERGVALWHTTAAGLDATGRPGNVFTHAAALLEPPPDLRPIDYWRSADWLTPFGPAEVNAARLGGLAVGEVVSLNAVIDFVSADDNRFVLEWLLAAFVHTYSQGKTLVLATSTPDNAAMWLGALLHLTSAAHARGMRWVTFERGAGLSKLETDRLDVVCIPREDSPEVTVGADGAFVVVDPEWQLGDPSSGRWVAGTQSWPSEPRWQNAMLDLFAMDRSAVEDSLRAMDDLTAELSPTVASGLPLHWPLSTTMLAMGSPISDRDRLLAECIDLIPPHLAHHPLLTDLVPQAPRVRPTWRDEVGLAPAKGAIEMPESEPPHTPTSEVDPAAEAFSYLDDLRWQVEDGPSIPPLVADEVRARLGEDLPLLETTASDWAVQEDLSRAAAAARLVAFLVRNEISTETDRGALASALDALRSRIPEIASLLSPEVLEFINSTQHGADHRRVADPAGRPMTPGPLDTASAPPTTLPPARLAAILTDLQQREATARASWWSAMAQLWVLRDVAELAETVPSDVRQSLESTPERWVGLVARIVMELDKETAAALVRTCLSRAGAPHPEHSVLSAPSSAGVTVGWAGIIMAWIWLSEEKRRFIFESTLQPFADTPGSLSKLIGDLMGGNSK